MIKLSGNCQEALYDHASRAYIRPMANIVEETRKDGSIRYVVKWRTGGKASGTRCQESFDARPEAEKFMGLVVGYGQSYPPGWVPHVGFVAVEQPADKPEAVPFSEWVERFLKRKSGIDAKTRGDYRKLANRLMMPWFGALDVRDEDAFGEDAVAMWVNALADGQRDPDDEEKWLRPRYSPKYIRNLHGLLHQIMQAAVKAKLRSANPCADTVLPRPDDYIDEQMCFLEYDEFQLLLACLDPEAQDLALVAVATGFRRGELYALMVKDVDDPNPGVEPLRISIWRAWKEDEDRKPYLGPPKSRRSRRTVAVAETAAEAVRRLIKGRGQEEFIFADENGEAWGGSKWYHRFWKGAIVEARSRGLGKSPSLQDLRHTHASWLIAANVPLPAIQRRLGHESITTTVDRYGHLVKELETEALAAIEVALNRPRLRVA